MAKIYLLCTGDVPSGWTDESSSGKDFYQKFIRGSDSYATGGGSNTHSHTGLSVTCSVPSVHQGIGTPGPVSAAELDHTHTIGTLAVDAGSSVPAYRNIKVISKDNGDTLLSIPSGVIAWFETGEVPGSGWSADSNYDAKYIRGYDSISDSGSSTHTHVVTGVTGAPSGDVGAKANGVPRYPDSDTHTHPVSNPTGAGTTESDARKILIRSKDSEGAAPVNMFAMFDSTPDTDYWTVVSNIGGDYYHRYLKADTSSGSISGAHNDHTDDIDTDQTPDPHVDSNYGTDVNLSTTNHFHTLSSVTMDNATPEPERVDVIIAKCTASPPTPEIPANPLIGKPLISPDIIKKAKIR